MAEETKQASPILFPQADSDIPPLTPSRSSSFLLSRSSSEANWQSRISHGVPLRVAIRGFIKVNEDEEEIRPDADLKIAKQRSISRIGSSYQVTSLPDVLTDDAKESDSERFRFPFSNIAVKVS